MMVAAGGCVVSIIALLAGGAAAAATDTYRLTYEFRLVANNPQAEASIELVQDEPLLREARFRAPPDRFSEFAGDGRITRDGDFVIWMPPPTGGRIEYHANLDHRRAGHRYDSLVTADWAVFRGDDLFPAARVTQRAGSRARSILLVRLPKKWTVITPYAESPTGGYLIDNPDRAFDRPTGWLIAGKLGRRTDMIDELAVSIAAPVGSGVERIAMLALLRWTLPYLFVETTNLPARISIVSAGEPMWRGGLSASNSVFVHADRPLLSENGTSTLLHEVVHVLLPIPTQSDSDWIDEGIAEYVTLRLLRDSGTISPARFDKAIAGFARRGRPVGNDLAAVNATGSVRARAVVVFAELDAELIALSGGKADLYDLIRQVRATGEPLDAARLRTAALELTADVELESLPVE